MDENTNINDNKESLETLNPDAQAQEVKDNTQETENPTGTEFTQTTENNVTSEYNGTMEYQATADGTQTGEYQAADGTQTGEYQTGEYQAITDGMQTGGYIYDQYGNAYAYGYEYVNPERNLYGEQEKDIIMAILSLVFGVIGILTSVVFIGLSFDIAAIVLAIVVLKRRYYGKKFAIAGLITSGIGVLLSIAMIVFICITARDLFGELMTTIMDYYYYYSDSDYEDDYYSDEYSEDEYSEDEYEDEYVDEYEEDEYIDDTVTDEGYPEEEVVEEEYVEEVPTEEVSEPNAVSEVSENEIYVDTVAETELEEEEYIGEAMENGENAALTPEQFMEEMGITP